MKKIIFCWELGGNYGHITSFLPFYRELIKLGIEVDFILRDLAFAHTLLDNLGVRYFQAPVAFLKNASQINTYSYADLLAHAGYLNLDSLVGYVQAWRQQLLLLDADLIVVDHAPTAILAARTLGIPTVMFGNGFTIPPLQSPMPIFHVWNNVPDALVHQNEFAVLDSVNKTLTHFDQTPLGALCDLFDVEERFLCATPEMDHYFERENDEFWGPNFIEDIGIESQWPETEGVRIFAYITPKIKTYELLLAALLEIPGAKLVHIPGASEELINRYECHHLHIDPEPINMKTVLRQVDLVVHQSGAGTTAACLLAGVKQLLVPTQLEQRMMCKKLVSQGLAIAIDPQAQSPAYGQAITTALADRELGLRLKMFAEKYFGFNQHEQYAVMAGVVKEILEES